MSGGSMNYLCFSLAEAVGKMQDPELDELVKDLSAVLYELEWWDSSDTCEERYREKAAEFKRKWFKAERNERLARYIETEMQEMTKVVKRILGGEENEAD